MNPRRALALAVVAMMTLAVACGGGVQGPATLDSRHDACRWCRMTVSDSRFAAQLVAPGEEPLFFDDIGCLAAYLKQESRLPSGAVAYVTDHRTREWVPASKATYTRVIRLETPMGSHLVAHADASSAGADPDAQDGVRVATAEIFGAAPPSGSQGP